jgi:hypothetical protein
MPSPLNSFFTSDADTVAQRAVNGLRSVPVCSVLFELSASALRCGLLRSAMFTHKMSRRVSGFNRVSSHSSAAVSLFLCKLVDTLM